MDSFRGKHVRGWKRDETGADVLRTGATMKRLKSNPIYVLEWPSQSPDPNPFKNEWQYFAIYAQKSKYLAALMSANCCSSIGLDVE